MSLFDFVTGGQDLPSLVATFGGPAAQIYTAREQSKQARAARRTTTQQAGWGGVSRMPMMSLSQPSMGGLVDVFLGNEAATGGDIQVGPFQSGQEIEGEYSYVDPATGQVRMKRAPTHPSQVTVTGTDGRTYRYKSEGRALLSTLDMSGYRKVCRVTHELLGGPKPTRSRRTYRRGKKVCRTRPKKVSCRTLSPKQLAAGFGGKQYKK